MTSDRVITAKLPGDLVSALDECAVRMDRSKSWIVRQAVSQWVAEEQRRYELTLEGLKDLDEGRTFTHEEVLAMAERLKQERRADAESTSAGEPTDKGTGTESHPNCRDRSCGADM